jgi:hypothetical protein
MALPPKCISCGRRTRNGVWCVECERWWSYWCYVIGVEEVGGVVPSYAKELRRKADAAESQRREGTRWQS